MYIVAPGTTQAYVTWSGRTRGGGNAAAAILAKIRVGDLDAGGSFSLFQIAGAAWSSLYFVVSDDGSVYVSRYDSVGNSSTSSTAAGAVTHTGDFWFWADLPATIVDGTNAAVYSDEGGSWAALAVSGATDIAAAANDLNGEAQAQVCDSWGIGPVLAWQGADRPINAAAARAVALAGSTSQILAAAMAYTGCCFAFNGNSVVDVLSGAAGVNTDGMFDGALWDPARRLVAVRGLR